MIKGLSKREKDTELFYNVADPVAHIRTHDLRLIKRLEDFSARHPDLCRLVEDDEYNGKYFDIDRSRVSIRITEPYSQERRQKQSEWARENGLKGNYREVSAI